MFAVHRKDLGPSHSPDILFENIKIPKHWQSTGRKIKLKNLDKLTNRCDPILLKRENVQLTTRTDLKKFLNKEFIPHISYDIDGDGSVGNQDYFISKMFDKGNKGYLDEDDKLRVKEALKSGFERNFVWNVEQAGNDRPYRLLQKRGKIIDAEDFQAIRETYPEYPKQNMSTIDPITGVELRNTKNKFLSQAPSKTFRSKTEMDLYRKEENVRTLNEVKHKYDEAHPPSVPMTYKLSEFLVENPLHKTKSQIQEIQKKEARIKCGLTAVAELHISNAVPSLRYQSNPAMTSRVEMKELIKKEKMNSDNRIFGSLSLFDQSGGKLNSNGHKDIVARLQDVDDASFRIREMTKPNPTFAEKIADMKRQNIEDFTKKFGNVTVGIHGHELPKFSDEKKKYWKDRAGYNSNPAYQSAKFMKEDLNPFKRNEPFKLADISHDQAPEDIFKIKTTRIPKDEYKITEKVTKVGKAPPDFFEPKYDEPSQTTKKWTEVETHFRTKNGGRFFDNFKPAREYGNEFDVPLYSSFAKDGKYSPPKLKKLANNE